MPVTQAGSTNLASLVIPDVYVNIQSPPAIISGIPTNILGIVGVASWGPVGVPQIGSTISDIAATFGKPVVRSYDLVSSAWVAAMQGANNFRLVRCTDGTDVAAQAVIQTSCITWTAFYSGTLGNSISVAIASGRKAGTYKVTVSLPGYIPEQFDNLADGLTGNARWVAIANAINNGTDSTRGPSKLIVATAGAGTAAPTLASATLSGGTDGDGITPATDQIGSDVTPRTGMYALRGTGASVAFLADCDDSTTWADQVTFGLEEGIYMIATGPAGDTISNAVSTKASAGTDSYGIKVLHGDWVYFNDSINGVVNRLISPQGFSAGKIAALSPEQSSLNKPLNGIVGTQASIESRVYSSAELQDLILAGIDVITNPIPAGNMFGARVGHNSSSEIARHGDNYTRMTNFLAYSLEQKTGIFIGQLQSKRTDDPFRRSLKLAIDNFLQELVGLNMLDDFMTICDKTNNSDDSIARGYCQVDVKAVYLSVVEFLIINLEGGQTVTVTRVTP